MAQADTVTTEMSVSATVANTCSVNAMSLNLFSISNWADQQFNGGGQIDVYCTSENASFNLVMGTGNNYSNGFNMSGPNGALLSYQLYDERGNVDPYQSVAYQNAGPGHWTAFISGSAYGGGKTPGNYNDSVTVNVNYNP